MMKLQKLSVFILVICYAPTTLAYRDFDSESPDSVSTNSRRIPNLRYQHIYNQQKAYQIPSYQHSNNNNIAAKVASRQSNSYEQYRSKWDQIFNNQEFRPIANKQPEQLQPRTRFTGYYNNNSPKLSGTNKCGVIKPIVRRYVANGVSTKHVDWPWYVQLIIRSDAEAYCGGTIISDKHILTAAHCFDGIPEDQMASSTTVLLKGVRILNRVTNKYDDVEVKASKVYMHEKYVPAMTSFEAKKRGVEPGPRHDLAILRIEIVDAEVLSQITAACLPQSEYQIPVGTRCKIMGHGFVNAKDEDAFVMPRMLQMADVFIAKNEICKAEVDSEAIRSKINQDTLCIRGPIHPCVGDSGGPLVCKGQGPQRIHGERDYGEDYDYNGYKSDEVDSEWYLAGVTSFAVSTDLQDKCGYFKSAVFGSVARNLQWITRVTSY